jgi:hypothetical protein
MMMACYARNNRLTGLCLCNLDTVHLMIAWTLRSRKTRPRLDDLLAGARAIRCSLNPDPLLVCPQDLRELGRQVL